MNELTKWYKALLESLDCIVEPSPSFQIKYKLSDDEIKPIKIKDKVLVLPTKEILEGKTDWSTHVAFHPACESVCGGQSLVLNTLLASVNGKVFKTLIQTASSIVELSQNTDIQDSLSLKQSELLAEFKIDKSSTKLLTSIINKTTMFTGPHPLIALQLKRGGEIGDVAYSRTCKILTHFLNEEGKICGCTVPSKTSEATIKQLFRSLLPDQLEYGTNSASQPYLHALLECYYRVALRLNFVIDVLGKHSLANPIDVNWHTDIPKIHKWFKQCLPMNLDGNLGRPVGSEKPVANVEMEKLSIPGTPLSFNDKPIQPQPTTQTLPTPVSNSFGLNPALINPNPTPTYQVPPVAQQLQQPLGFNSYTPPIQPMPQLQQPQRPLSVVEVALGYNQPAYQNSYYPQQNGYQSQGLGGRRYT